MIVIADTSGLIAAFNPSDPEHAAARTALTSAGTSVVSPLVMLEIEHVAARELNRDAGLLINDWLLRNTRQRRIIVATLTAETVERARRVQDRYADLRLDLTDAVKVVLAAEFQTEVNLTLDHRDFRAISPLTSHSAFRLLPADA